MNLERQLLIQFATEHPTEATRLLGTMSNQEVAQVLGDLSPPVTASLLHYLPSLSAALALEQLPIDQSAAILADVRNYVAASILRVTPDKHRAAILNQLPANPKAAISGLLVYAEDTAGALMDVDVLTAFEQEPVGQALERLRHQPEHALYYLYVVAADQCLVGVVNIRELMRARPDAPLAPLCTRQVESVAANATWQTVVGHPAWGRFHALPVVEKGNRFVGVIRYKTVRDLERRQAKSSLEDRGLQTASALGEVFGLGLRGLLQWPAAHAPEHRPDGAGERQSSWSK